MSVGSGPPRARAGLRSESPVRWSCTVRSVSAEAAGLLRRGTTRRPAGGRPRGARTTRPRRGSGSRSRRACSSTERREVSPLVTCFERVAVVGGVRGVDLDGSVAGQQGGKSFVEERRVRQLGTRPPRLGKELLVDGGADSNTGHATLIAYLCHIERVGAGDTATDD